MGTRGVTGYKSNGKWVVTYNHYDSYPAFLGKDVLTFCKQIKEKGWQDARTNLEKMVAVQRGDKPGIDNIMRYCKYADRSVSGQNLTDWYCLLRDLQGVGFLQEIENGNLQHFIDNHMFMQDSLSCEWGYIIDLDKNVLRVYKGYNRRKSIRTVLPADIDKRKRDDYGCYAIKEVATIPLNDLPDFLDDNGKPVNLLPKSTIDKVDATIKEIKALEDAMDENGNITLTPAPLDK